MHELSFIYAQLGVYGSRRWFELISEAMFCLLLFLMPPVCRSQIEVPEIRRSKGLEVRLSFVLVMSTIQVIVRISSSKFPEGKIDGDTTDFHLHNLGMELKGGIFSSPLRS
ncbi:hypothetical protein TNCV_509141 [Trichonephila clavipes]|nr:hypothetical protein TNCV_509141 [Trichonephila clavipes]